MEVKVTIDLADKAQAAAFQNLVSAQAAAAQKPISFSGRFQKAEREGLNEDEALALAKVLTLKHPQDLHDEQMPAEAKQAMSEYNAEPVKEKKTRAPRKTQATEEQPADMAAAENVEVNEPEEVTPAAEVAEESKPLVNGVPMSQELQDQANDISSFLSQTEIKQYTEQEVRQLVADKVNAHRPVIVAKLNALGSKSVTLLPKEKYGELVAFLNSLD